MPEQVTTDAGIADCYDVMAELRPHIVREQWVNQVRALEQDGFRLACIRAGGRVSMR